MSRAPFGRRPRRAAPRRHFADINWKPCCGGCGAQTIDGRACGVCLSSGAIAPDARCVCKHPADQHRPGFCNQLLGGGFRCNCRGFLLAPSPSEAS